MRLKAVSGIMLILLLIGMLILTFNIQPVKASGTIYIGADLGIGFQDEPPYEEDHTWYISNRDDIWGPPTTMVGFDYYATGLDSRFWDALSLKFDTSMYEPSEYTAILRFYAQKGDYGNRDWHHYIILEGDRNPTYEDIDYDWEPVVSDPNVHSIGDTSGDWFEEPVNNYWISNPFWVTLRMWNVRIDAVELLLVPPYELTVTSSPIAGITFTINGTPQTTPYTEQLIKGSYTLEMPVFHNGYVWSHWLEDGDPNRIKTILLQGTTWTAVYEPAPPPVGGEATPINLPISELELLTPYVGLTILLAVAVVTFVYVKKRKRN